MGFSQRTVTVVAVALTSSGLDGEPGSSKWDSGGGGGEEDFEVDSTTVREADQTA